MKALVLGASGMLGNAMLRTLAEDAGLDVYGTARSASVRRFFTPELGERILTGIDGENQDSLVGVLFPTVELALVVRDVVLPRPDLAGLYHLASALISKLDLLRLLSEVYGKAIEIAPDDAVVIDRSLNADRFRAATGYVAPPWPELVKRMFMFK